MVRSDELENDLTIDGEFASEETMRGEWGWSELLMFDSVQNFRGFLSKVLRITFSKMPNLINLFGMDFVLNFGKGLPSQGHVSLQLKPMLENHPRLS